LRSTGATDNYGKQGAVAVAVESPLAAAVVAGGWYTVVTAGYGGEGTSSCSIAGCVTCPCAASKATLAQKLFAPEEGPDCTLCTEQSFALRSH